MKKEILNLGVVLNRAQLQKIGGGNNNATCDDGTTFYGSTLHSMFGGPFTCYDGIGCFENNGDIEFLCDITFDPEHFE